MVNAASFQEDLRAEAAALGFAACGFASAATDPLNGERLEEWLGDGRHGSMEWMEARKHQRASPQGLWPDARSVIALGMSYAPDGDPLALEGDAEAARISVYAQGRDYHDVVKKALKALARWMIAREPESELKVFVDTAPVMEKPLGQAAGIGWQGKHTNLVSCPTDAFPAPYQLDARRCISYLTIEHKGPVAEEFRAALGNRIYGCDDCLAVCPWNKFADIAHRHLKLAPREELVAPRLAQFLQFDDAGFRQFFSGSPIKRIGRDRFVRNCLYAAGNSANAELLGQVERLRGDPDPVVRDAADWAAARLRAIP